MVGAQYIVVIGANLLFWIRSAGFLGLRILFLKSFFVNLVNNGRVMCL